MDDCQSTFPYARAYMNNKFMYAHAQEIHLLFPRAPVRWTFTGGNTSYVELTHSDLRRFSHIYTINFLKIPVYQQEEDHIV